MPEMHLRQPGFIYSACGLFPKNKERIQKFKETEWWYIYQNELDKAYLQHDMAYGGFKDLPRRAGSDQILPDKASNISKNSKYDRYQRRPASMTHKFFDKKPASHANKSASGGTVKNEIMSNQELAKELQKQIIIRKLGKRKVQSSFLDNIQGVDLPYMQLISKFSKWIQILLCVIDVFSKYAWVIPLKDKKDITITNAFQIVLNESNPKQRKYG